MNRKVIRMSLAGISALMGGMFNGVASKSVPSYTYGGSSRNSRTKGKRHKSLTQRSNRRKASA